MNHEEFFISGKFGNINMFHGKESVNSTGDALQLYYLLFLLITSREFLSKRGVLRPF